jgi:hypothetical protein
MEHSKQINQEVALNTSVFLDIIKYALIWICRIVILVLGHVMVSAPMEYA